VHCCIQHHSILLLACYARCLFRFFVFSFVDVVIIIIIIIVAINYTTT